jgi:hypothetical protein
MAEKTQTQPVGSKVQTGVSFEILNLNKAGVLMLEHRWDRSTLVNWLIEQEWEREHPGQSVDEALKAGGLG